MHLGSDDVRARTKYSQRRKRHCSRGCGWRVQTHGAAGLRVACGAHVSASDGAGHHGAIVVRWSLCERCQGTARQARAVGAFERAPKHRRRIGRQAAPPSVRPRLTRSSTRALSVRARPAGMEGDHAWTQCAAATGDPRGPRLMAAPPRSIAASDIYQASSSRIRLFGAGGVAHPEHGPQGAERSDAAGSIGVHRGARDTMARRPQTRRTAA